MFYHLSCLESSSQHCDSLLHLVIMFHRRREVVDEIINVDTVDFVSEVSFESSKCNVVSPKEMIDDGDSSDSFRVANIVYYQVIKCLYC